MLGSRVFTLASVAITLLVMGGNAAAEPHPFSVQDMVAMHRISDPQPAPDGKTVVFTVSTPNLDKNGMDTDLWMVDVATKESRQLTSDPAGDFMPRWGADGELYFLSSRSGSVQLWRMPMQGGEALQVTDLPLSINTYKLSPKGDTMVVSLLVYPDCADIQCTLDKVAEAEANPATGRIYDSLLYRHWDTWRDGRRYHLFALPMSGEGELVNLMQGVQADSPTFPWGGDEEIAFTPDGKELIYTAKVVGDSEAWSTDYDLYQVPLDGQAKALCITDYNEAWDTSPVFSPMASGSPMAPWSALVLKPTACASSCAAGPTAKPRSSLKTGTDPRGLSSSATTPRPSTPPSAISGKKPSSLLTQRPAKPLALSPMATSALPAKWVTSWSSVATP